MPPESAAAPPPGSAPGPDAADRRALEPGTEERQWAMLCHVSGMLMYVTVIGGLVATLAIWLLKRNGMPFVDEQGREAVNFQLTMLVALLGALILMLFMIGYVLFYALLAVHFVLSVLAAVKVTDGAHWRHPLNWRVLK